MSGAGVAVGVGAGVVVGVGIGEGVAVGVGEGVAVGVGVGEGVAGAVGAGDAMGAGEGVADAVGVAVAVGAGEGVATAGGGGASARSPVHAVSPTDIESARAAAIRSGSERRAQRTSMLAPPGGPYEVNDSPGVMVPQGGARRAAARARYSSSRTPSECQRR